MKTYISQIRNQITSFSNLLRKILHSVTINRNRKKSFFNLRSKKIILPIAGILIGVGLISFFLLSGKSAAAAWWNDGWNYRKAISVSNTATALTDYQIKISLDTDALIAAGKMQSDCDDIRIVDQNGRSYDFLIEPSTCDTTATIIWTKIPELPSSGADFYLYYGNVLASSVSKTTSEIFLQEIENVVGGWLLDEASGNSCTGGEDSCDSSGGDYDLTWGSSIAVTTGKVINGLSFNGTDDATAQNNSFDSISGTKRWTVALWFKTSDTDGYLFDTGDVSNTGDRVAVFTDGANNLSLYMSSNTNGTEYKYLNYSVTSTDNNWHYLVVTRDGDNSVKLYVDATPISVSFTTTDVDMTSYSETWTDFLLGHRYTMNIYNYTGIIDEARVYSVSLSSDQISALYGNGTNRHGYVTANYPGTELMRTYSSGVTVGSPATEEVGPGPLGYWKFDEGYDTFVNDSSGNNHTANLGTGSSAPTWKSEEYCVNGNCLEFDGTNDSVSAGDILDFTGNTEMTVSAWVKLISAPSAQGQVISKYDAGTAGQWYLGIDGNRKVTFLRECGSYGTTGNTALDLSSWNHISGVYDGSSLKIYINGTLDKTVTDSCSISNTSVDLIIGAGDNGSGTENHFPGFIDEVKVYPYARSEDEIKQDYLFSSTQGSSVVLGANETSFLSNGLIGYWEMDETTGSTGPSWTTVDSSGSGNDGTGRGNATTAVGKFGNGGSFDGTGDYIQVATGYILNETSDLTLSAWIKTSDTTNNDYIISKYRAVWLKRGYALITTAGKLQMLLGTEDDSATSITSNATVATGSWVHVVGSIGADNIMKLYVNGVLDTSAPYSGTRQSVDTDVQIGAYGDSELQNSFFNGSIDEVRIFDRELSSSEIKALYNWAPGPVVYYDLNENSGVSTVHDKSGNGNTGSMNGFTTSDWKTGKYGSSLTFDETDNYLELANNTTIQDLSGGDFTTSFWLKTVQSGGYSTGIIATKFACFPEGNGWNIYLDRQNLIVGIVNQFGTTDASFVSTSDSISSDEWAHVTVVWHGAGKTADIYVDGVEVVYNTQTAGVGTLGSDASLPLRIGKHNGCSNFLNGQLDDFRIYNYARTPSQIIEDMNAGHPAVGTPVGSAVLHLRMDEGYGSTAHNSGTAASTYDGNITQATWTTEGKYSKALNFDSVDDRVIVNNSAILKGSSEGTVCAWIYPNNVNNSEDMIYSEDISGGSVFHLRRDTSNKFSFGINDNTTWSWATASVAHSQNQWYHVCGSFIQADSSSKLYVNGELEDENTAWNGTWNAGSITNVLIGDDTNSGTYGWGGYIDEVKVYPFSLTNDQILVDYNKGKTQSFGSTNTESSGNPSNSSSREYCVPGDTTSCNGPVIELNFDEQTGTTANDISANANSGALTNGPSWKPSSQCKSGSCLEYNGTDQYVNITTSNGLSSFSNPQTAFTLEGWMKTTATGITQYIYSNTTEDGWHNIAVNTAGQASMGIRNSSWGGSGVNSTSIINDGQWHHIVGVFNNPTMSIYVDGVLENTISLSGSLLSSGGWGGGGVRVGVYYLPDGGYFDGNIDNVRVYNYARTPAQIAWDMNKGAPIIQYRFDECQGTTVHDVSGNGHNATMSIGGNETTSAGTCNSSATSWGNGASGKWNASLDLDGADDYLSTGSTVPSLAGISEMSVCSWIKYEPASVTADGVIVGQYSGSPPGWLLWVDDVGAVFGETNTVSFSPNPIGGSAGRVEGTTGLVSTGIWDHYCGVFKGGNFIRLYKNGVLNAENTSSIVSVTDVSDTALQIGRWTNFNNSYFDGQVDDIRIYNYALTGHQIKEVYGGGAVVFK